MNMAKPKQKKKEPESKRSILGSLLSKPERDKEYMSDLQTQWANMDNPARIKFVVGMAFGLIVFIAALGLTLYFLSLLWR
jgi:hypothetical protein